jgi:glutaconate CoA-transferase subunit B
MTNRTTNATASPEETSGPQVERSGIATPAGPGAEPGNFTTTEMMTIAAARLLKNNAVCFVGIGLPSTAANLARLTHAPDVVLIYESGPIGAKPHVLPLSIGDGDLAETADTVVSTPEIFRYWLQGGRIDVGFLGAAQIDRFANINTTVIGDYHHPKTRLPGAGGAPEIASSAKEVFVILKQTARAFVERLDFITSVGFLDGGDARARLGLPGNGPVVVVTDLCIMEPDPKTKELTVTSLHPGVTREQVQAATAWPIRFAAEVRQTPPPTPAEMGNLRDLERRTAIAHQRSVASGSSRRPRMD